MTSKFYAAAGAVTLAGLACMSQPAAAAANLIVNGSFETADFTGWTVANPNPYHSFPTIRFVPNSAGFLLAEDGTYYLADGNVGEATLYSQTFSDTAGATYQFSFWYWSTVYSAADPATNLFLSIDGVKLFEPTVSDYSMWRQAVGTFIGTGSDTLTFGSRDDPGANFVDNFVVSEVTAGVPEPAAWSLMILGFGLSGFALRRQQAASAA